MACRPPRAAMARVLVPALVWLGTVACIPQPDPLDPDDDGDGVSVGEGDCDDADPGRYPGAVERCDGADNDCDGLTDEDAVEAITWRLDGDGDGYGNDDQSVVACDAPDGHVVAGGDCDDEDAAVFPGAEETCDDADEDCDGEVDEGLPTDTWYPDADGDGYGDEASPIALCGEPGSGLLEDAGDCDDAAADTHPGADELCDDRDNDCNGLTDEGLTVSTWYPDLDGDGYGNTAEARVDCAAPKGWIELGGDCDDEDGAVHPGRADPCDGVDQDCDGVVDEDAPTWWPDGDGDGYGDAEAAVSACVAPSGHLPEGGVPDCDDSEPLAWTGAPESCGDGADNDCDGAWRGCGVAPAEVDLAPGWSLAGAAAWSLFAADLDGDGVVELVAGAAAAGAFGEAVVAHAGEVDLVTLTGDLARSGVAGAVGAGDTDGDGVADLLLQVDEGLAVASGAAALAGSSAPATWGRVVGGGAYATPPTAGAFIVGGPIPRLLVGLPAASGGAGAVALLDPPTWVGAPEVVVGDAVVIVDGAPDTQLGAALALCPDADGDGVADAWIGAPGPADGGGAAWWTGGDLGVGALTAVWTGAGDPSDAIGVAVACLGDFDGDGYGDGAAGGPGGAYVVLGAAVLADGALAAAPAQVAGGPELAGTSLAAAGDVDGDELEDLWVGAPGAPGVALLTGGASGVLAFGDLSSPVTVAVAGGSVGSAVAAGDLDGDGLPDLGAVFTEPGLPGAALGWLAGLGP
jgi:hypothetical protein